MHASVNLTRYHQFEMTGEDLCFRKLIPKIGMFLSLTDTFCGLFFVTYKHGSVHKYLIRHWIILQILILISIWRKQFLTFSSIDRPYGGMQKCITFLPGIYFAENSPFHFQCISLCFTFQLLQKKVVQLMYCLLVKKFLFTWSFCYTCWVHLLLSLLSYS